MSPLEIEILIHYYCTMDKDVGNFDAPAVQDALKGFKELGLLELRNTGGNCLYQANREALTIYIDALCAVPLPEKQWIIPNET